MIFQKQILEKNICKLHACRKFKRFMSKFCVDLKKTCASFRAKKTSYHKSGFFFSKFWVNLLLTWMVLGWETNSLPLLVVGYRETFLSFSSPTSATDTDASVTLLPSDTCPFCRVGIASGRCWCGPRSRQSYAVPVMFLGLSSVCTE